MNIVDIKSFLAVVEFRSISLASKQMHISQPAMTKRMQKLENELGTQLLHSTGMRTELTEKGKQCIPYIRQLLHIHEEMLRHLGGESKHPQLVLNIGVSVYIAQSVLPGLQKYMSTLNNTSFSLNVKLIAERDILDALHGGSLDLAISPIDFNYPKTITSVALWRERLLPVVAKNYLTHLIKKPITFEELALYDVILMEKGLAIRQKVDELAWHNGIALKVLSESNTIYNNIALIEQKMGWSVIYERLLKPELSVIVLQDTNLNIQFDCHFLVKRKEERIINVFVDHLKRYLKASEEFKHFAVNET